MALTVLLTAVIALIAMFPGLLLLRGGRTQTGQWAAAATASLIAMMLITALIGKLSWVVGLGQLPAATIIPVSAAAALLARWRTRGRRWAGEPLEWQGAALALLFIAFGLFSLALAVRPTSEGGLLIHSWYNADWFKHLGHVHALADYGVPARDIFGSGSNLYYYWLSYILPGAGASLGGDGWAALTVANMIITALFCFTFYAVVRMCTSRAIALTVTLLGLFVTAPPGFALQSIWGPGLQALLDMPIAPKGPALLALAQYIPQHALAATLLLSWAALHRPDSLATKEVQILALISLASAMTISTLLGATLLTAYGLTVLAQRGRHAIPELLLMAIGSGMLVLVLGVLPIGNPDSALEGPLFSNQIDPEPWLIRTSGGVMQFISFVGLPLIAAIFFVRFWRPSVGIESFVRTLAICLVVAAAVWVVFTQIAMPARIAVETLIRAVIPAGIGVTIIGAWALTKANRQSAQARWLAWGAVMALVLIALPCVYVRMAWMARFDDNYTTLIPRDDLEVLAYLKNSSRNGDIVWQYPEPPILADPRGHDAWAAVLAGRTVLNSQRATDYAAVHRHIETSQRFFAAQAAEIPEVVDWVYLSRILHAESYDAVLARMRADSAWRVRACYADACLFSRAQSTE